MNNVLPLDWVRAARYCELTGESMDTVYDRITGGTWAAGKHYKRTGPKTLWINLPEINQWIKNQPHVEALGFPRGSKSETGSAARASA